MGPTLVRSTGSRQGGRPETCHQLGSAPRLCTLRFIPVLRCLLYLQKADGEEQRTGAPVWVLLEPLGVSRTCVAWGLLSSWYTRFKGSWGSRESGRGKWVLGLSFQWLRALTVLLPSPQEESDHTCGPCRPLCSHSCPGTEPGWCLHMSGSLCVCFLSSEAWNLR